MGGGGEEREREEKGRRIEKALISLDEVLEELRQISVTVEEFQGPTSQAILNTKLNKLIELYSDLDTQGGSLDTTVPLEAVQYVDHGLDPAGYAQGALRTLADLNTKLHGQVSALDAF